MFVFRALASGSSGNAYVLKTEGATLLFEAGLRLPQLRKNLAAEGIHPSAVSAVLISHEHRDHCASAADLADEYGTPVVANEDVLRACGLLGHKEAEMMPVGRPTMIGDVEVTSFPVSHDAVCPVGFLARAAGRTIVIATDTGKATVGLLDAVSQADLVVLEANHDTEMLAKGRYPYQLRKRVSGPKGHLSNAQAAHILAQHAHHPDVEVWLAHLSKENNTASIALRTVRRTLKSIGLSIAVDVALRDRPSLRWTGVPRARQLSLFGAEAL